MDDGVQRGSLLGSGRTALALAGATGAASFAAMTGLLDPMALLITVGGTLAVTRATYSGESLRRAWTRLAEALREETTDDGQAEEVITTFKRLARIHRVEGARALDRAADREDDPFLRRAVHQALEARDVEEVREALFGEARVRASEGERSRNVLLTLGRLFPAFGLIGTLIGLAMVLRGLGGDHRLATVAPALGVTVLTTLYGAILANVVVLPLATKLHGQLVREGVRMQMIIHGAELLHAREYPTRIERALRAHAGLPTVEATLGLTVLHERAA